MSDISASHKFQATERMSDISAQKLYSHKFQATGSPKKSSSLTEPVTPERGMKGCPTLALHTSSKPLKGCPTLALKSCTHTSFKPQVQAQRSDRRRPSLYTTLEIAKGCVQEARRAQLKQESALNVIPALIPHRKLRLPLPQHVLVCVCSEAFDYASPGDHRKESDRGRKDTNMLPFALTFNCTSHILLIYNSPR